MKGLHISDLHLDRPFAGFNLAVSTDLQERLSNYSEKLFSNIKRLIKQEEIELVLISGDTFHTNEIDRNLIQQWQNFLVQLVADNVTVYLIAGNHDPLFIHKQIQYPEGVYLFDSEDVETKYYESRKQEQVAISAFSYEDTEITTRKDLEYPSKLAHSDYHLGIYHGQQQGIYAPFSLIELQQKQYDYFALGHYHNFDKLTNNIIYAGTAQPKNFRERNGGQAIIFECTKYGIQVESYSIDVFTYQELVITTAGQNLQEVEAQIRQKIQQLPSNSLVKLKFKITAETASELVDELQNLSISTFDIDRDIVNVEFCYDNNDYSLWLDEELEEELVTNYQKPELIQALYSNLTNIPDIEAELEELQNYQVEIIKTTMQQFKYDLENN